MEVALNKIDDKGKPSTNVNIIYSKITEIMLRARARANQAESADSDATKEVKAKRAGER